MIKSPISAVVFVLSMTALALLLSINASQKPLLGLDLQGGVEVVLEPLDTPANLELATPENLNRTVEILRKRVDAIGVAEPDITAQTGDRNFIIVQLPGIEDQAAAVELVGQTAELQFRPVLFDPAIGAAGQLMPEVGDFDESILNGGPGLKELVAGVVSDAKTTPPDQSAIFKTQNGPGVLLGPTVFSGGSLEGAKAQYVDNAWMVEVIFKSGPEGLDLFNSIAAKCYERQPTCPQTRLAFVLDGVIESAPTIESPSFYNTSVSITRTGGFEEQEAKDTALVLDFGALPLAFADPADPTAGLVRTVSATLGHDSLEAGLIAGIVGIALVALYMIAYYRLLGVIALASLLLSGTLLWIVVSWLSATRGLALTLAGVVGLIVSIGVSLDSNVVFFEDLKETLRRGSSVLNAVDETFPKAFSTVFWANLATLIGALILYLLTAGSVRGFALMLAIASILDLVASYFFMAPLVKIAAKGADKKPALFGVRRKRESTQASSESPTAMTELGSNGALKTSGAQS